MSAQYTYPIPASNEVDVTPRYMLGQLPQEPGSHEVEPPTLPSYTSTPPYLPYRPYRTPKIQPPASPGPQPNHRSLPAPDVQSLHYRQPQVTISSDTIRLSDPAPEAPQDTIPRAPSRTGVPLQRVGQQRGSVYTRTNRASMADPNGVRARRLVLGIDYGTTYTGKRNPS